MLIEVGKVHGEYGDAIPSIRLRDSLAVCNLDSLSFMCMFFAEPDIQVFHE